MKIRYYLRGLGLGILFTSIFFLVSNNNSAQTMSDEMIKARAKELGMVESVVLAELPSQEETAVAESEAASEFLQETSVEETVTEEITEEVSEEMVEALAEESATEENVEAESEAESEPEEEPESVVEADSSENASEEAVSAENTSPNETPVSIMVNSGDGSDTVSIRLQEAGLVADAYEYDRYLMANGYDKKIRTGEHIIPAGATWEDIARILCNQM